MPVVLDMPRLMALDTTKPLKAILKDEVMARHFYEYLVRSFNQNEADYWVGLSQVYPSLAMPAPPTLQDRLSFKAPKLVTAKYPRCAWLYEEYVSSAQGRIAPQQVNIDSESRLACNLAYDEAAGPDGLAAPQLSPELLALTWTQLNLSLTGASSNWKSEILQLRREAEASLASLETNDSAVDLMKLYEKHEQNLGSLRGGRFFVFGPMIDTRLLMLLSNGDRAPMKDEVDLARRCLLKSASKRAIQALWAAATERGKKAYLVHGDVESVRLFRVAMEQTKHKGAMVISVSKEDVIAQFLDKKHWERKTSGIDSEISTKLEEAKAAAPVASLITLASKSSGYETVAEALKGGKKMLPKVGGDKLSPALDQFISKHTKGTHGATVKDRLVKLEKKAGTGFWCLLYRRVSGSELKPEVWLFRGSSIQGLGEPGRPDRDCWLCLAK